MSTNTTINRIPPDMVTRRRRPVHRGGIVRVALTILLCLPLSLVAHDVRGRRDLSFHRLHFDFSEMLRHGKAVAIDALNSPDREDMPLISADGMVMYFTSDRQGDRPWARYNRWQNRYDTDVWVSTRLGRAPDGENWSAPVNLGSPINSSGDEDVAAISADGQSAYFTSLHPGWEADGGPFYFAALKGAQWSALEGLGGGINEFFHVRDHGGIFKVYGASISADGRAFYFATTLHSPDHTHQIWVSHLGSKGWGYPENLGPVVNGPGGSCAPFIAADGKTLFFAADRPEGAGGDDVYMTVRVGQTWHTPENVGQPINTAGDDAFLSVPASGERVYLSSSRGGDNNIYVAPLPEILRPGQVVLLGGTIVDKATGKPLEASITIEDLRSGVTVYNANSNATSGRYTLVLEPGRDYSVSIAAPGYGFTSRRYAVAANAEYDEMKLDFSLQKLGSGNEFALNNIFYDFDSYELRDESRPELDRLVRLMADRPDMRIMVCGHTDSVGGERYNALLSLRRAESVREYLTRVGGVDAARVVVRGYGAQRPAATNETDEGRQLNRRITFVIE
jgi:outer membrane protein OmpA-like peptidoglycan-associated protein